MAKLYSLQQPPVPLQQSVSFQQGDWVRYIGRNPKIQQDYGNQDLRIVAIDWLSEIAVCDTKIGQRLVGVALRELRNAS
ncbi:hypothetical protein H6F67_03670 [Microcoleus sp. FACHB-1515]|uniref:hypothetical protein n=1 Tax=Cyanophyceae TaxID=3028117 RepID=UPI0016869A8D|nr:hypothetical protein [Microcoleus sp. FACHB-1515]MBD2088950.1 hypothetical protein [Microcoleus sp. FACHB-1515]